MAKKVEQHLIAKSNALIQASYKLTLNEQRLILLAISGLNSKRISHRAGYNQVDGIRITAAQFSEAWKLPKKDAYASLKDATNELFERSIIEVKGKKTVKDRWVSRVTYHDGEGWAELSLSPHITPHLTSLGQNYTAYRLGQVANLRSTYAIRLFEWCIQFVDNGWLLIQLDDFVQRLGVAYTRYADIRRYVIEPAVAELQAKSNLAITWAPIKDGKKVTSIRFEFKEQSQKKLDL